VCLNVHRTEPDEHGISVSWLCGQCTGILSATNGDPVCVVSDDKSTVSIVSILSKALPGYYIKNY